MRVALLFIILTPRIIEAGVKVTVVENNAGVYSKDS